MPSICHSPAILAGVRWGWYLYPPEYQAAFLVQAVGVLAYAAALIMYHSPLPSPLWGRFLLLKIPNAWDFSDMGIPISEQGQRY